MYKLPKKERDLIEHLRGRYSPELKWYGVMTHSGHEHRVRERIQADLRDEPVQDILLPEIISSGAGPRRNTLGGLLFPCYLFLRCVMNDTIYQSVASYDRVFRFLGPHWRIPSILNEDEIRYLQGMLKTPSRPVLIARECVGAIAEVTSGMMQGMRGHILEANASHVKIEAALSFLNAGTSIAVSVPTTLIRLLDTETGRIPCPRLEIPSRGGD